VWHLVVENKSTLEDIMRVTGFRDVEEMRGRLVEWYGYDVFGR